MQAQVSLKLRQRFSQMVTERALQRRRWHRGLIVDTAVRTTLTTHEHFGHMLLRCQSWPKGAHAPWALIGDCNNCSKGSCSVYASCGRGGLSKPNMRKQGTDRREPDFALIALPRGQVAANGVSINFSRSRPEGRSYTTNVQGQEGGPTLRVPPQQ